MRETGKPIAQVARDLGINAGTLGNWVAKDRAEREGTQGLSTDDLAELKRLRAERKFWSAEAIRQLDEGAVGIPGIFTDADHARYREPAGGQFTEAESRGVIVEDFGEMDA